MPKCGSDKLKPSLLSKALAPGDERSKERRKLYDQGLGDRAIARIQGVDKTAIRDWRKRNQLTTNHPVTGRLNVPLSSVEDAGRHELYQLGLGDGEIAAHFGIERYSVFAWRKRRGLTANIPAMSVTPETRHRCIALLRRGISASIIVRETPVSLDCIERWRAQVRREQPTAGKLPPIGRKPRTSRSGRLYKLLSTDRRPKAFALYADGLNDRQIALELGCSISAVWEWRQALYLPPAPKTKRREQKKAPIAAAISALSNPIYARIAAAVGFHIAADLREDAISDLFVAVQEGRFSIGNIAQHARRAVTHVVKDYANPWGDRSLDEEIGDGEGFRMIDMLKDTSSSDWLEEMGATVW